MLQYHRQDDWAVSKHFCWPSFFMKGWVLWPEAITQHASALWPLQLEVQWRGCKLPCGVPLCYFNNFRVSNNLSTHHSVTKKILYNYHIIALNCPMLKQGIKTISTKFIWTCALYWLFWFSSDLCNLFPRVSSLFDVNVKKKKRPGRWFWTLCLHSRPLLTIDARVKDLVSNMDYL